ncbi:carboxymuconolactone decarboxylase family protein [Bythopirellula goksoeyrii]|uniref:Carboxymuconolactone decarboxylase family protein n=1 Tax=Bythopirellula goksoeyrii TaxID=1400387 RepID=A0A5B9QCT2_9BACT|nr:carboxymuconolactone decarboxylase family protein [Bythopirellula goksoeyrii]QEG34756.1 Carboxymuconolactone decarboxylase family protein [Bythopirellula goksoeyrii]
MSRLPQIAPDQANPQQAELFESVKSKLGRVPNLLRVLGNSTAALRGYLDFSGALSAGGGLDPKQREIVALTVAQANDCEYCLAAHSTIGKMVGLSPEAIEAARRADGYDELSRAVARFADAVVKSRGRVDDEQLDAFRAAGFNDDAVTEVVAHVALNVFTNYLNNLAETDVDFPAAAPLATEESEAAACSTACGCTV